MSAEEYPKPGAVAPAVQQLVATAFLILMAGCIVASCAQSRPSTRDKVEAKALPASGQRLAASQMETATTPMDVVYRFEQVVDAMFRETDETAPIQESYKRSGLILLSRRYVDGRLQLELNEYETGDLVLDRLLGGLAMDRATLEQLDKEAHSRRQLDFGLADSLLLVPVSAEGEAQTGDAGKLRFEQIYLPGVLPSTALTKLSSVGQTRTDRLEIKWFLSF